MGSLNEDRFSGREEGGTEVTPRSCSESRFGEEFGGESERTRSFLDLIFESPVADNFGPLNSTKERLVGDLKGDDDEGSASGSKGALLDGSSFRVWKPRRAKGGEPGGEDREATDVGATVDTVFARELRLECFLPPSVALRSI